MKPTKLTVAILCALILAAVAGLLWQLHQAGLLAAENAALREQANELGPLREENQRLTEKLKTASALSDSERSELLRLRGQVAGLRRAEQDNARLKAESENLAKRLQEAKPEGRAEPTEEKSPEVKLAIAKMEYVKNWGLGLLLFAQDNNGRFPANPAELAKVSAQFSDAARTNAAALGIRDDQFEILFQGRLNELSQPATTLVMREKQPYRMNDGRWARSYLFADGHSEIHAEANGDFSAWEKRRLPGAGGP